MEGTTTKDKILAASAELFARQGFTETSIKQIAKACGIKTSSIYFHYASKHEILDTMLDMYIDKTAQTTPSLEETDRLIAAGASPEEVLRGMFYKYDAEDALLFPLILKVIQQEQYRNDRVQRFMREHFIRQIEDYICAVLEKLMEAGLIRPLNSRYYAKLINSLNIATMVEVCHMGFEEYTGGAHVTRMDILHCLIETIAA